jgi:uncharacterized cupin superfamily protein
MGHRSRFASPARLRRKEEVSRHYQRAPDRQTDEAVFILSGTGKVRTQDGVTAIGPGDYVPFAPGGDAHQLINDGDEPLVYLGMSAGKGNDVTEYPDSKKVHVVVAGKSLVFEEESKVDYFKGELETRG